MMKRNPMVTPGKVKYYISASVILALLVRVTFIWFFSHDISVGSDQYYYDQTAKGILAGEGYHSLNLLAYQPPLFAYFVSTIYGLFEPSLTYVLWMQAIIGSLTCIVIYRIGKEIDSETTGILASFLAAGYVQFIRYTGELLSETLFIFLVLSAILSVLISERKSDVLMRIVAGVLFGLAALTREVALVVLIGFIAWYYLLTRDLLQTLKKWFLICVFACLTILPWTVRNYLVFHAFVPISTCGNINLYLGNNSETTGEYIWILPPGAIWNKASPKGRIELETSRLCFREGLRFIYEHPGKFVLQSAKRIVQLWAPPLYKISLDGPKSDLVFRLAWLTQYSFLFILAGIIGPFLFKGDMGRWGLPYAMIVSLSIPYFFTLASARFRLPLVPFMIIITSGALRRIFEGKPSCSPRRLPDAKDSLSG